MDQCLVDGSPWLFAVTHVLHRFLAPRHPPLALCSLEEQRCSCSLCNSQGAAVGLDTRTPATRAGVASSVHQGAIERAQKTEQRTTARRGAGQEVRPTTNQRISRSNSQCINWESPSNEG